MQHHLTLKADFLAAGEPADNAEPSSLPFGYYSDELFRPYEELYYTGYIRSSSKCLAVKGNLFFANSEQWIEEDLAVIQMGPNRGHLDYMMPETVLGSTPTGSKDDHDLDKFAGLQINVDGGFIRDDREELQAIADAAWEWYETTRTGVRLPIREITNYLDLGTLLVSWVDTPEDEEDPPNILMQLNTVITAVSFDFVNGSTQLQTNWYELDPQTFADPSTISRGP